VRRVLRGARERTPHHDAVGWQRTRSNCDRGEATSIRPSLAHRAPVLAERPGLPGAVVIGGDYQGLGIVRSLGRRGIDVIVVDDERSISRHSRYVTAARRVPNLRSEVATVEALLELRETYPIDGWVVYPTREETVAALSRNRERLTRHFRIPTPTWDVVERAYDKRQTYKLAERLNIPTPRTWTVHDVRELDVVDGDPPFVIKPAIKERFLYSTRAKAWRADNREELRARFEDAAVLIGEQEVMIQEHIPGNGDTQFAYCAFFKAGGPVASMSVQRLRQHPAEFGRASTFVQTVEHPLLEEMSLRFLRSINYYGLVELEYKLDRRDDSLKLLDVNARTWGYHSLGQRAGVDFPYVLYADQVALPVPEKVRATPGISWIRLATDLPTASFELIHRRLDWRAYMRSLLLSNVESVFSHDDLSPGLAEVLLLPYLAMKRGL
jgi:D-aspartate ligase